jgi:hypothetical protein
MTPEQFAQAIELLEKIYRLVFCIWVGVIVMLIFK